MYQITPNSIIFLGIGMKIFNRLIISSMAATLIITGVFLDICLAANHAKPGIPPVYAQLSASEMVLESDETRKKYESVVDVMLKVGSNVPNWQVHCVVEPLDKLKKTHFKKDIVTLKLNGKHIDLSDKNPTFLVGGAKTGPRMAEAGGLNFSIKVDPFKPPQTYQCRVHFLLKGNGISGFVAGPIITLSYKHQQFVCVEMDPKGLTFNKPLEIGDNRAGPAVVSVHTNMDPLNLVFSFDELNLKDSDLPRGKIKGNMIAIGGGFTAEEALANLQENGYGHNQFGIMCPAGHHTIFIYNKVKIDLGHRPGDYEGVIKVQF